MSALLPHRVLALHVEHVDAELLVQHDDDEELQQQREEEVGHREAEVRERRGRVVEQRVLPNGAHDADDQGEHHREHQGRPDQEQGVPGGFAHHVDDRTLGPERLAPVALHEVAQPAPVLRRTGLVEVVLVLQVAQRLLRDARTEPSAPAADRHAPTRAANTTIVARRTTTSAVRRRRTTNANTDNF